MKELTKIAVVAILILALSPLAGFWVVALVGALLFLLPAGAAISVFFPKVWRQFEDSLLAKAAH